MLSYYCFCEVAYHSFKLLCDTSQTYLYFLMLHACLYTICFVFCYTLWRFYAFFGTNLLTRCHSVSSCFLLFLCFRKATQEIFSELDETKPNLLFFPKRREVRRWDGGGPEASHTLGWRGPGPGHATRGWGCLVHLLTPPFRLYIPLDGKNLKTGSIFLETYCKPPSSLTRDREDPGALPGTLPERGIPAGGLLHHHGRLRSDVWVVYLGLRVHSSSLMVVFSTMCFMFRSCELPIMIKIIFV
jgi:hypothetical protein